MSLLINPAMVSTTSELPGFRITECFGVTEGSSVAVCTGFTIKKGQKDVLKDTIREAFVEMVTGAALRGANAVVGLRYNHLAGNGERVVIAYGTAVKVEKIS
jgi:uncharacterized protein YbjQ (UPF0145 family)